MDFNEWSIVITMSMRGTKDLKFILTLADMLFAKTLEKSSDPIKVPA